MIYLLAMASLGSLHPYLALALEDAGATAAAIPLIAAAFPIARLTAGPLSGWLADRYARPDLILQISALTAGLCGLALGVAPGWVLMGAVVYLLAFCRVPLFPLLDVQVVRTAGGYGTVRMWGSVGFVAAVIGVGQLADAHPRLPALVAGGALVATFLGALTLPRGGPRTSDPLLPAMRRLLQIPELRPLWLLSALHAGALSTYDHLFSLHVSSLGLSAKVTSAGFTAGVGTEICVLAAGPWLLRRFGAPALVVLASAVGIPRWLITGTVTDPAVLAGIQCLHGFGFGCWWVGGIGLLADRAPDDLRNSAQALFVWAAYGVGTLVALGLSSLILRFATSSGLFLSLTVLSAGALLAALPLRR